MQQQRGMPCTSGFQGIFGIAFRQLDLAFSANSPAFQPFDESGNGMRCPTQPAGDAAPPLMQFLRASAGPAQVGIYWSGRTGLAEGALYLEEAATSNEHYAQGDMVGQAALGELGWYDITIQQIALPSTGQAWTDFQCDPAAGTTSTCIMDTGTPVLSVPKQVYQSIVQLYESSGSGQPLGSLSVTLAGKQAAPVTLEFSVATLLDRGWIQPGGSGIILGLPLWAFYYTVFDVNARAVTFVANPQGTTTTPQIGLPWFIAPEGLEELETAANSTDFNASLGNVTAEAEVHLVPEKSTASLPNASGSQGHERRLTGSATILV